MRTCLNLVTLQRGFDTLQGIAIAAKAGFGGVGIWADSLESQASPVEYAKQVAKAAADSGLRVEEMCFVGGWMWAEGEDRQKAFEAIRRRVEIAAAAACPLVIACASGGTGEIAAAAEDFRQVCEIGREHGISFALEYIGAFPQIKDIPSGLEVVRAADHPNGKLLIDIFHTFRGGSPAEDFKLPQGKEVGLVHMNDVPAGDLGQMNDSHRVMPGAGVLPLTECLSNLRAKGYDGALSVEVFSQDWWQRPAEETAAAAFAGLSKAIPA
jgi:2-keto-myo-inositol isomerase